MHSYEKFINISITIDLIFSQHLLRILAIKMFIALCDKVHIKYYESIYEEAKKFSLGVKGIAFKGDVI